MAKISKDTRSRLQTSLNSKEAGDEVANAIDSKNTVVTTAASNAAINTAVNNAINDLDPATLTEKTLTGLGLGVNTPITPTNTVLEGFENLQAQVDILIGGGGEVNTASNVGTGEGVFKQKVGVNLQFKSMVSGTGVSIVPNANDLTFNVALTAADVGLGNVDNTSDINKPVSTAQQSALDAKKTDSMNTNKLLGRGTIGIGSIEEITVGSGLTLTGTTLSTSGGAGANTSLSNLTATSINQNLIPSTTNNKDIGSASFRWSTIHSLDFIGLNSFSLPSTQFTKNGVSPSRYGTYAGSIYSSSGIGAVPIGIMTDTGTGLSAAPKIGIETGYVNGGTFASGGILIRTGNNAGTGAVGGITIQTGNSAAVGGNIVLKTGTYVSGAPVKIHLDSASTEVGGTLRPTSDTAYILGSQTFNWLDVHTSTIKYGTDVAVDVTQRLLVSAPIAPFWGAVSLDFNLGNLFNTSAAVVLDWSGTGLDYKSIAGINHVWQNGYTASRPVTAVFPFTPVTGTVYFDTDLGKPIWYFAGNWVDAAGTAV